MRTMRTSWEGFFLGGGSGEEGRGEIKNLKAKSDGQVERSSLFDLAG